MKTLVIDGNNLIHKIPRFRKVFDKDKSAGVSSIIEAVLSRKSGYNKIQIVFDGHGKSSRSEVTYSGSRSADEVIREIIESAADPRKLTVISSDTGIARHAKACGCVILKSELFWKESEVSKPAGKNINQNYIYEDLEKPERLSKKEIDEFRKYFS